MTSSIHPEPSTADPLEHRRAAVAALGHELRTLVEASVRTETATDTLHRLAEGVRRLTAELTGRRRARAELPSVDKVPGGPRMYNPVSGAGSPFAPPLRVTAEEGGVVGRCRLGVAHEGPPGYAHGGMSAMLLDEVMGRACVTAGLPGMTVSLQTNYRRPVPLETPLRLVARVTGSEGRKIFVAGSIAAEEDPGTVLVAADGVFVSLNPEVARALFPTLQGDS